jgi:hypothetical protein
MHARAAGDVLFIFLKLYERPMGTIWLDFYQSFMNAILKSGSAAGKNEKCRKGNASTPSSETLIRQLCPRAIQRV